MKKIFKIASLLLLSGSVVLYTSCTKDYGTDVSDLNKKVEDLSISIASQSEQIESLESLVGKLESIQKTLQDEVAALKTAKTNLEAQIAQKADKTDVTALQTKVSEIEKTIQKLQELADQNAKDIASLKEEVAKKADKSWVEQTFATITRVQTIESDLGTLSEALGNLNDVVIPTIQKDLKTAADNASKALGEIETIKGYFNNYYTISEINQKLSTLKQEISETIQSEVQTLTNKCNELKGITDKQDSMINVLVANKADKADLATLEQTLQAKIDAKADTSTVNALQKQLDAVNKALATKADTSTVNALERDLIALQKKVEESITPDVQELLAKINSYGAKLDAAAVRVTSISVCPTLTPEYVTIVTGSPQLINNFQYMLVADFAIEPASKVDEIVEAYKAKKDSLHLNYSWAMSRTKSEVQYASANITSVYKVDVNGSLRVVATGIKEATYQVQNKKLFYALEYESTDSLGTYAVMSDFVEAIEAADPVEMTNCFKFAKMNGQNIEFLKLNSNDEYRDTTKYDYIAADTLKNCLTRFGGTKEQTDEKPFADKFVAVETSFTGVMAKIFTKSAYTVKEYEALTGQKVNLSYSVNPDAQNPVILNHLPENDFDVDVFFEPKSPREMFSYVSDDSYPVRMSLDVNEVASPYKLIKDYKITKKEHPEVTLPDTYIYWNYKQYKSEDRKDTLDASQDYQGYKADLWKETITKGAYVATDFAHKWLVYSFSQNGYQPLYIDINGYNYENDFGSIWKTEKQVINTFCVKETYSDWYKFNLKTTIETPLNVDATPEAQTIDGSVTKDREFTIKGIDTLYISPDGTQNVRGRLISGLKDSTDFSYVKAAFDEQMNACTIEVWSNGHNITSKFVSSDPTQVYNPATGALTLTFKAGTITYNEDVSLQIKVKGIFGLNRNYQIFQTIKTNKPSFGLQTKNWIDPTTKIGTAIGKIDGGVYKLEQMFYNKQVEIKGLDQLNASESVSDGDVVVKFNIDATKYSGVGNTEGESGIEVSLTDGSLANKLLTWGTYNGLKFDVTATLWIKDTEIPGSAVTYTIETKKPVRYVSHADYTKTRTAATNLDIKIWENAVVYGVVENQEVASNIVNMSDGTISQYENTYFEYDAPSQWTVKLNGSAPTSWISGVDYKWNVGNSGEKPTLTIMGDNLQGKLEITIKSKLHSYLDGGEPEEKDIHITVNQN